MWWIMSKLTKWKLWKQKTKTLFYTLEKNEGAIRNAQTRETGNIGHTRRRKTKQKHNTMCVGHHYAHANTNNVNRTWSLPQTKWTIIHMCILGIHLISVSTNFKFDIGTALMVWNFSFFIWFCKYADWLLFNVERRSLKRGSVHMKFSMTGQGKCDLLIQVTVKYRWLYGQV
jgi:hypothetical protein